MMGEIAGVVARIKTVEPNDTISFCILRQGLVLPHPLILYTACEVL